MCKYYIQMYDRAHPKRIVPVVIDLLSIRTNISEELLVLVLRLNLTSDVFLRMGWIKLLN